jgi:hypothetical protein
MRPLSAMIALTSDWPSQRMARDAKGSRSLPLAFSFGVILARHPSLKPPAYSYRAAARS